MRNCYIKKFVVYIFIHLGGLTHFLVFFKAKLAMMTTNFLKKPRAIQVLVVVQRI